VRIKLLTGEAVYQGRADFLSLQSCNSSALINGAIVFDGSFSPVAERIPGSMVKNGRGSGNGGGVQFASIFPKFIMQRPIR
jgi:hypothetical protein